MTHSFLSQICGQNSMYVCVCVCVSKLRPCCLSGGVLTGGLSPGGCVFFLQHSVGLSSQNWKQWLGTQPNAPLPSHPLLCWWVRQHVMLNGAFTFLDAWVTPARWWELHCDLRRFFFPFQRTSSQSLMFFFYRSAGTYCEEKVGRNKEF